MNDDNPQTPEANAAGWWDASISRRDANTLGVGLAAVATAAGLSGCDQEKLVEMDSIAAQKKGGWDVGETGAQLLFKRITPTDSTGAATWKTMVAPAALMNATRPKRADRQAWEMPTLIQSLEQRTLSAQMKPVFDEGMEAVYARGPAVASLVAGAENPEKTLLIVDMPGAASVALAAGMADSVEPVFHFDNWPHPKGVVPSHLTLGALVYYGKELEKKAATRDAAKAPTAIVLDAMRLVPVKDAQTQFDNRYAAALPEPDALKKAGIARVLYVTGNPRKDESDDLNDVMVGYEKAGLAVAALALSQFAKDPDYKPAEGVQDPSNGYHYGGRHEHHTHFYSHYPMFIPIFLPSRGWRRMGNSTPPKTRPPAYKPKSRPTTFSSRRTGGAAGVGRTKPTGFGRVSTRVDGSGRIRGTRHGSFGRMRSSSSFGG